MKKVGILRTSMLECSVEFPIRAREQKLHQVLSPQIIVGVKKGMLTLKDSDCKAITLSHTVKHGDFIHVDIA